ncbi:hypothetical protein MKO06_08535 [Gramella sp. GC03-9]|uniref:Uncharacterized protein n=1 Tax=Christiangramia oceanisediminis TaxID=2920386 RepID=A0A9X2KWH8_9FLAO|nr:hypothetical protein [Gramella oceanisediminis]MCP9199950.1 hypothetical protein [Gramella oceanisediminis]
MRLLSLSKSGDNYLVKARTIRRIFGITISTTVQEYINRVNENEWYSIEGKKITDYRKTQLDKWLKDHQRFIEH